MTIAILFDLIVVAGLVGEGWRHFRQPVLWVAYALLVLIPWLVGIAAPVAGACRATASQPC